MEWKMENNCHGNKNVEFKGTLIQICKSSYMLCSYKTNTRKISHSWSLEFSSYIPVKFAKSLFTKIRKQESMLKISLLFNKNTNFTGE